MENKPQKQQQSSTFCELCYVGWLCTQQSKETFFSYCFSYNDEIHNFRSQMRQSTRWKTDLFGVSTPPPASNPSFFPFYQESKLAIILAWHILQYIFSTTIFSCLCVSAAAVWSKVILFYSFSLFFSFSCLSFPKTTATDSC